MNDFIYLNKRPHLVIEYVNGGPISNCYSFSTWRVTSRFMMSKERLIALNKMGLIGTGQEFMVTNQCDGKEQPAGYDDIACVEVLKDGTVLPDPPINPYSGKLYANSRHQYYVYECMAKCDSGD